MGRSIFEKYRNNGILVTKEMLHVETTISAGMYPMLDEMNASTMYSAAKMPTFTKSRTNVFEVFFPTVLTEVIFILPRK